MTIARLSKFWSHSVTVYRETEVGDDYGGKTRSREKKTWNIPVRISTFQGVGVGRLEIVFSGKSYTPTHRMFCDVDADIILGDKLKEETSRDVYLVLDLNQVYKGRVAHHIEAMVRRVDN